MQMVKYHAAKVSPDLPVHSNRQAAAD